MATATVAATFDTHFVDPGQMLTGTPAFVSSSTGSTLIGNISGYPSSVTVDARTVFPGVSAPTSANVTLTYPDDTAPGTVIDIFVEYDDNIGDKVANLNGSYTVPAVTTTTVTLTCTTPPPAPPTAVLTAVPTSVLEGSPSTLNYATTHATSASINQGVGAVTPNTAGTHSVSPTVTTTYTLTATGPGGVATAQATVTVVANEYEYTLTFQDIPTPSDLESIPRARTTMKRRPAGTPSPSATGDTLLLIGCALDGPSDYTTSASDLKTAAYLYGPQTFTTDYPAPNDPSLTGSWSGNTLMKALSEASGARNVRLLRVGGVVARGADLAPGLHLSALYAGSHYNGASVVFTTDPSGALFAVTPPKSKGRPFTLRVPVGRTLGQICNIFNADPRNQAMTLVVDDASQHLTAQSLPVSTTTSTLMGGLYGTEYDLYPTPADLYNTIAADNGPLDIARDSPIDFVHVAGLYADDDIAGPNRSFVQDLGSLCLDMSQQGTPVLATIGLRPLDNPTQAAIKARVNSLLNPSLDYDASGRINVAQFLDNGLADDTGEDIGRFVSVVAGPDVQYDTGDLPRYVENPAVWYAVLAAGTVVPRTTTNKDISSSMTPVWRFTHRELNMLNGGVGFTGENPDALSATEGGGAYVAFKQRPFARGWCVVEDVTAAPRNSPFSHLYVSRVLQAAEEVVQAVVSPYVGQPNNSGTIAALDRQLEANLNQLSDLGVLQGQKDAGYGYRLWSTVAGYRIGVLYLTLWLLPVGQIHRIDTMITVS